MERNNNSNAVRLLIFIAIALSLVSFAHAIPLEFSQANVTGYGGIPTQNNKVLHTGTTHSFPFYVNPGKMVLGSVFSFTITYNSQALEFNVSKDILNNHSFILLETTAQAISNITSKIQIVGAASPPSTLSNYISTKGDDKGLLKLIELQFTGKVVKNFSHNEFVIQEFMVLDDKGSNIVTSTDNAEVTIQKAPPKKIVSGVANKSTDSKNASTKDSIKNTGLFLSTNKKSYTNSETVNISVSCTGRSTLMLYTSKDLTMVEEGEGTWSTIYHTSSSKDTGKYKATTYCNNKTDEIIFCVGSSACDAPASSSSSSSSSGGGGGSGGSSSGGGSGGGGGGIPGKTAKGLGGKGSGSVGTPYKGVKKKPTTSKPTTDTADLTDFDEDALVEEPTSLLKYYIGGGILLFLAILTIVIVLIKHPKKQYNHHELIDWIKKERMMKTSDEDIRQILKKNTQWTDNEVTKAFALIDQKKEDINKMHTDLKNATDVKQPVSSVKPKVEVKPVAAKPETKPIQKPTK